MFGYIIDVLCRYEFRRQTQPQWDESGNVLIFSNRFTGERTFYTRVHTHKYQHSFSLIRKSNLCHLQMFVCAKV